MNKREDALRWWRDLNHLQQCELIARFFPNRSFIEVSTSSSKIEQMFLNKDK